VALAAVLLPLALGCGGAVGQKAAASLEVTVQGEGCESRWRRSYYFFLLYFFLSSPKFGFEAWRLGLLRAQPTVSKANAASIRTATSSFYLGGALFSSQVDQELATALVQEVLAAPGLPATQAGAAARVAAAKLLDRQLAREAAHATAEAGAELAGVETLAATPTARLLRAHAHAIRAARLARAEEIFAASGDFFGGDEAWPPRVERQLDSAFPPSSAGPSVLNA
jgi:hypothetical protein